MIRWFSCLIILTMLGLLIPSCAPGMPKGENPKYKGAIPEDTSATTDTGTTDTETTQPADTGEAPAEETPTTAPEGESGEGETEAPTEG